MPTTHTTPKQPPVPSLDEKDYSAPFTLGLLSLILVFVPFVGLTLATIGLALSVRGFRTIGRNDQGYPVVTHIPWAKAPSRLKTSLVLSCIGFGLPFLVLFVIGAIMRLF